MPTVCRQPHAGEFDAVRIGSQDGIHTDISHARDFARLMEVFDTQFGRPCIGW